MQNAFRKIDRANFLRPEDKNLAHEDRALPIGFGQTNSQPTVVKFMLEQLAPERGERILDIGCGSGWTTALLAELVGPKGQVVGVELVPELVAFGQENLRRCGVKNAYIKQAEPGRLGLPDAEPFDRILVSAAAQEFPGELMSQFTKRLVIPIRDTIRVVDSREYGGFVFVPLII